MLDECGDVNVAICHLNIKKGWSLSNIPQKAGLIPPPNFQSFSFRSWTILLMVLIFIAEENRKYPLLCQAWLENDGIVQQWFRNDNLKKPQVKKLFSENVKMRPRTSSVYWDTPVRFDERFPISSAEYASW